MSLTRKIWLSCLVVCLGLGLAACAAPAPQTSDDAAQATAAPAEELPERVRTAVAVARAIDADPDAAERILEQHGLTADGFEELMYEIARDPQLSAAYQSAMR